MKPEPFGVSNENVKKHLYHCPPRVYKQRVSTLAGKVKQKNKSFAMYLTLGAIYGVRLETNAPKRKRDSTTSFKIDNKATVKFQMSVV